MLLNSCLACCARVAPCPTVKISALRRKLWKAMLLTAPPPPPSASRRRSFLPGGWRSPTPPQPPPEADWAGLAHALLKHLSLAQMERLAEAVEAGADGHSYCLRVSDRKVHLGRYGAVDIIQLVCRLWRWPKAPDEAPLVNFCDDEEEEGSSEVCINPYHWSLRLDAPPSSLHASDLHPPSSKAKDLLFGGEGWPLESVTLKEPKWHLPSTDDSAIASSLSTEPLTSDFYSGGASSFGCGDLLSPPLPDSGSSISPPTSPSPASSPQPPPVWCSLSYWELLTHVGGHWFPLRRPRLHLCGAPAPSAPPERPPRSPPPPLPPNAARLDLGALQARQPPLRQPMAPLEAELMRCVSRTRRRIGAGLVLVRRGPVVWLHNRSAGPVFVSPQCDFGLAPAASRQHSDGCSARRLPPDHALALFDLELWRKVAPLSRGVGRSGALAVAPPGPIDPRVVHVSFAKGWGLNYKRQDITLCPCRLEILFHLPKA